MFRSRRIREAAPVALATAIAAVFIAASPAAMAATEDWYSQSNPLIAWEDGEKQALAYGTAYTKEGNLKNHTFYKDPRPGGSDVYTQTDYDTYNYDPDGVIRWHGKCCSDQSARDDSGYWQDQYDAFYYADIDESIEKGRVYYKVCEDQPHSPDPCSNNPFITFSL